MKKNYFLIILFLISFVSMAQVTTSTMSGLVKDDSGLTLPGANILATHVPTGSVYGAMTNIDGRFRINNMRIGGPYTVAISYVGFETETLENINLDLGETFNIEVTLLISSNALDEVTITVSDNPTFSSQRTGAATQVTSKDLKTLAHHFQISTRFYKARAYSKWKFFWR